MTKRCPTCLGWGRVYVDGVPVSAANLEDRWDDRTCDRCEGMGTVYNDGEKF
jgi:hypothetical protein